jgi:hypothetical protein
MKRRLDEKKTPISFKKWGHSPIPNQTSQFLPWMQEKSQRIRNSTWGDIGDEYTKKRKGFQMDFVSRVQSAPDKGAWCRVLRAENLSLMNGTAVG